MKAVNALPAAVRPPGRVAAPSFADVVAEHLDAVYRYLVYLTGDRAAAEDLAAETFERAFRSWRRFDPRRGAPRTWLCRIAHSAAVDWFRAEARRQRREESYSRDEAQLEEVRKKLTKKYGIKLIPPFRCDFRDPFGNRIQVVDLHDESLVWLLPYGEVQKAGVRFSGSK